MIQDVEGHVSTENTMYFEQILHALLKHGIYNHDVQIFNADPVSARVEFRHEFSDTEGKHNIVTSILVESNSARMDMIA